MKKITSRNKVEDLIFPVFVSSHIPLWVMLIVLASLFTLAQIPPRQNQIPTTYSIGDVARRDIKSSWDFFVEDPKMTEKKRSAAKKTVKPLYDLDTEFLPATISKIQTAFSLGKSLFPQQPQEPFSQANQQPAALIQKAPSVYKGKQNQNRSTPAFEEILSNKPDFENILGIRISKDAYKILYQERFASHIHNAIITIIQRILDKGIVSNKEILLKERGKGIILRDLLSNEERLITNLETFYGPDQARTMAKTLGKEILKKETYNLKYLIIDICQQLLQPNITLNRRETEQRRQKAASRITRAMFPVKAGEMIIREGELVDKEKLLKLSALKEKEASQTQDPMSFMGIFLLSFSLILVSYRLFLKDHPGLKHHHNKHMFFLFAILLFYLALNQAMISLSRSIVTPSEVLAANSFFMLIPIPSASMIVCIFLGFDVAVAVSIIISILTAIAFGGNMEASIFYFLSGITAAHWVANQQKRKNFIGAGFKLGIFNTLLAASFWLYSPDHSLPIALVQHELTAFFGGILSAILTVGISPMVETGFNYTTETRLLELSNLDQPLIKRLMLEAPGTYNHSLIVGTLAEAAASAIGASGLLAKVMGYYHDIGKLDKPLYFVENQSDGRNRHDKLSPSMSALILIQHVKRGVELARQYRLGSEVIEGIVQHHGTSLIKYFYVKSQQTSPGPVNEADFRYPGPKPQTREAGIVMLADVAEASVRALERPTAARIKGRVKALVNDIFADGQLEECELTLKDLHAIAKSFNTILTSIYHNRIEYPDKVQERKNGTKDTDRQPPRADSANGAPVQKDTADLRRLGLQ